LDDSTSRLFALDEGRHVEKRYRGNDYSVGGEFYGARYKEKMMEISIMA